MSQVSDVGLANQLPQAGPQTLLDFYEIHLVVDLFDRKRLAHVEIEQHTQNHSVGDLMRDNEDVAGWVLSTDAVECAAGARSELIQRFAAVERVVGIGVTPKELRRVVAPALK